MKQLVFIDDSGDPGFTKASSSNFVMAAALFMDQDVARRLSECILQFHEQLDWREEYEFKFTKIRKDIIAQLLRLVTEYDFEIYAVYIEKESFFNKKVITNEKLYNWTIKELLLTMPLNEPKIKIDGRSSKRNMQKTATYLRQEALRYNLRKLQIGFEDSSKNNLIQLADLIAGSINRSLTSKTDSKEYIEIIKEKIVSIKKIDE
ncbi:DUF3800 domain-containing protein [Candidatus Saccharibacteria bacterium]|nr:DUF3800 domain-containing protein [Candidatus Saccharibacteria bacterium]